MIKEKITKWKEEFVDYMRLEKKADSTIQTYWGAVVSFVYHFNTIELHRISSSEIGAYILHYDNARTMDQKRYAIQLFYKVCIGQPNKLSDIPKPKRHVVIPQVLNIDECFSIFLCIDNLKQRTAIQITYACALRRRETLSIKMRHIDFVAKELFIENSKGAKDRKVPIPQDTITLIQQYIRQEFDNSFTADTYLFQGQKNYLGADKEQYSGASLRSVFKRAISRCNILKHITLHTLRHSRATHWHNAGIDIHDLAKLLGHNNIKTTQIYLHTGIEDLQDKVLSADEIIKSRISSDLQKRLINDNIGIKRLP